MLLLCTMHLEEWQDISSFDIPLARTCSTYLPVVGIVGDPCNIILQIKMSGKGVFIKDFTSEKHANNLHLDWHFNE